MALVLKDRVKELSTTSGTGTLTLAGAVEGYQAFSVIGNSNVTYYTIYDASNGDWEVGYGTYTASGTTLSRTFVYDSSNSGNLVDFSTAEKEVFCTYPSEQAIYQETNGDLRLINGVIEVSLDGTQGTTLPNATFQAFATENGYIQNNIQNLSGGADASSDFVATNNQGDDESFYIDMGINSSGFNSGVYEIYTENSGYLFSLGDGGANPSTLFVGSGDGDVVIHAGGWLAGNVVGTASGTDQSMSFTADVSVGGALDVTGAATFGGTVLLNQDPSTALQAATKQYVDQQSSTGIHIHEPCTAETSAALSAVYTQGGTTFNITDITGNKTLTTSVNHGLSVGDEIWLYNTAGNGLSTNTAYFVYSTPALNQLTVSLLFGGAELTGLTNASGLTYNTRANSGVGAYLEASANQALPISGVVVSDRVLVYNQTTGYWNGVYTVDSLGSVGSKWKLTRATDANKYEPSNTQGLGAGDYFFIQSNSEAYVLTDPTGPVIIGYDTITYTLFSSVPAYTVNSPLSLVGTTLSLTTVPANLGGTSFSSYTTGDMLYATGSTTLSKLAAGGQYRVLTMGASTPEWNAVALDQANAVSGSLGATNGGTGQNAYATGDTLYASATNTLSKLSGNTSTTRKFLGQTGTGSASAAPVWDTVAASDIASGTLAVARGGTGLGSYAVGDIVYASGTGTLAGLADTVTGNVLLSGGTNTAPAYGKVGLTTHVSGTLALGNGGTGQTTAQAAMNALAGAVTSGYYLRGNGTNVVMAAIVAGDVPTLNQNTTGSAGSVVNALTMNNGGAGAASGTTFNGSAAQTISYNTIGASPLAGSTSLTTTGTVTTGTWSGLFGAVSGANLTNLTAGNLSGTIPSAVLGNSTVYVGTTATALNRASANQALTGISSVTMPGSTSGTVQVIPAATAGTGTVFTIPATTGTAVTTGDTGTVTNTMLAGSIANAKLANSSITINGSAVSLGGSVTVTATASNALTISSPLSGTSYNGSAAVTIALSAGYGDTQNPYASKTANYFLAAPNGTAGAPTFRAIVAADIPTLNQNTTGSSGSCTGNSATATTATNATNTATTDDVATATAVYPTWVDAASGNNPQKVSSTKLTFVPSTGTLTATVFSGSGASLTSLPAGQLSGTIPSAVLGNSTHYIGTTAVTLNRASANLALTGITSVSFPGSTSGTAILQATAIAGTPTLSLPTTTGTLVGSGDTGTVTNTMLAGSIANAKLANSSVTINGSAVSLGGSITVTATATNALTIGSYLTGTSYNGSAAVTIAADATSANTASKLVARDASGNFSAGTITATLSGSATSATTATTATNATNVGVTDDVATATSVYISWVGATSGNNATKVSSTKLTMVPSTGTVTSAGNFVANSDERIKTNWRPVQDDFVTKLAAIKSGVYDRTDVELTQAGVSAQSWQALLPETVQTGDDGKLSVAYGNAALVAAIELAKEVVKLREELAALKSAQ